MCKLLVLFLLIQTGLGEVFHSEFVQTFINNPWILSNKSYGRHPTFEGADLITVSVVVDNWSQLDFSFGVGSSSSKTFTPPKNVPGVTRSLVSTVSDVFQSSGLIGWHLIDPRNGGIEAGRLTLAWNINKLSKINYAVFLGTEFLKNILETDFNQKNGILRSSKKSGSFLIRRGNLAVHLSVSNTDKSANKYILKVSMIPSNFDVWGWIKYYKPSTTSTTTPVPTLRIFPKNVSSYLERDVLTPSSLESAFNGSLRDALALKTKLYRVAVGIQIENWSKYRLIHSETELDSGKIFLKKSVILPGTKDIVIVTHNEGTLSGTLGIVRYEIESRNKILTIMWSVPYNRQLWKSWAAIGITSSNNLPSLQEMYSSNDINKFVRRKSGRRLEFSDGEFLIVAEMDGGPTYKPIFRVGFIPLNKKSFSKNESELLIRKEEKVRERTSPKIREVQSVSNVNNFKTFVLLVCILPSLF